jgi:hypothetical protein
VEHVLDNVATAHGGLSSTVQYRPGRRCFDKAFVTFLTIGGIQGLPGLPGPSGVDHGRGRTPMPGWDAGVQPTKHHISTAPQQRERDMSRTT